MTKISKRLLSIADFISKEDELVDVGCDHGLLSIYLIENKLCKRVIASDINPNALNNAIENIKKKNLNIETILSDGIDNIDLTNINTLIISGMGTSTILHILKDNNKLNNINKIIIQSNNEHEVLRKEMNNKNYYLKEEKTLKDKNKWYITMYYIKSNKKNTKNEIEYGDLNNQEYIKFLLNKYNELLKIIPKDNKDYKEIEIKYNKLSKIVK